MSFEKFLKPHQTFVALIYNSEAFPTPCSHQIYIRLKTRIESSAKAEKRGSLCTGIAVDFLFLPSSDKKRKYSFSVAREFTFIIGFLSSHLLEVNLLGSLRETNSTLIKTSFYWNF